jgi:hypothetical protein
VSSIKVVVGWSSLGISPFYNHGKSLGREGNWEEESMPKGIKTRVGGINMSLDLEKNQNNETNANANLHICS